MDSKVELLNKLSKIPSSPSTIVEKSASSTLSESDNALSNNDSSNSLCSYKFDFLNIKHKRDDSRITDNINNVEIPDFFNDKIKNKNKMKYIEKFKKYSKSIKIIDEAELFMVSQKTLLDEFLNKF